MEFYFKDMKPDAETAEEMKRMIKEKNDPETFSQSPYKNRE